MNTVIRKILVSGLMACVAIAGGLGSAVAQDAGFKVIPVEMYACKFNDGQDAGDLDKWAAKWNEWADGKGVDNYAAWTLTPYYFGPEQSDAFDVIWLGASTDAATMGETQTVWMAENDGLAEDIEEIMTCSGHSNFASVNYKPTPEGETPSDSVLTFSDCSFKDGANFAELGAAMGQWAQHLTDEGSNAGIFHWYPAFGGGGEKFDFKQIQAHESLATLGADYDRLTTGRGFETRNRLLSHMVDCDSSRVYLAKSRRFAQLR